MYKVGDKVYAIVKNSGTFMPEIIRATVTSASYDEIVLEHKISTLCTSAHTFPTEEWIQSVFRKREDAEAMLYEPRGEEWRRRHGLAQPLDVDGAALYRCASDSQLSVYAVCSVANGTVCLVDMSDGHVVVCAPPQTLAYDKYAECRVESITADSEKLILGLKKR